MKSGRLMLVPVFFAALAGLGAYYAIDAYLTGQAVKNVRDILLSHRGVHLYMQRTMHPEFYRARNSGEIEENYYAPEILSSSFMVRVLHGFYNEERARLNLPPVYYKLAAMNPRNPVNRADSQEERLIKYFRENPEKSEYQNVEEIGGKKYLVFAMPFLRNEKRCLVCHGDREDAPPGLQERYPDAGGLDEKAGELRAVESVRIPIEEETHLAWVIALTVLAGFGTTAALFVFNRVLSLSVRAKTDELAKKEKTFRKLLEASDAIPFEYAPDDDTYTYVGDQFEKILGEPASSLACIKDWEKFVHPGDRETELRQCVKLTREGKDHVCRIRLLKKDGPAVVADFKVNIVAGEGSKPIAVGFIHDVTALVRSETLQKARIRVAGAAAIMDFGGLTRLIADEAEALTDSRIAFFHFVLEDQRTVRLTQWSTKTLELCDMPGPDAKHAREMPGAWAECFRTGETVVHNDYDVLTGKQGLPQGHVPLTRDIVIPVKSKGRVIAVIGVGNKMVPYDAGDVESLLALAGFAAEIILRKQAEEAALKFQEQLLQVQKVESIGRLAGGIAHDFNNMLGVIMGHAEIALGQIPGDSPVKEDLEEIRTAAERSAAITRQLLAFARKQVATPVVLDVNKAISQMLKMLRRLIGEDIDLTWSPGSGIPGIYMDPSQMDQILANLATNARDAIEGVGKMSIETRYEFISEEYAEMNPEAVPGRYVVVTVGDSGRGMDREELAHIFEPFFTTKKEGKGTGLGLSTVYGIVKQNKGFINVYSEPGTGTAFRVYLPVSEGSAGEEEKDSFVTLDLKGDETILLVEDEQAILKLASIILKRLGYNVIEASGPDVALARAAAFVDKIDLLVTDVVMPGMNGKDLSEKLTMERPGLKTLFVSGYTSNVIAHHGMLDEGVNFLAKPYSPSALMAKVRSVLDV